MFEDLIQQVNNIEKEVALLVDLHLQQTNSLTTYNDVARFLGKTPRTIRNYIKDSKLVPTNITIGMLMVRQFLYQRRL